MIDFKDPEHLLGVLKFAADNNCAKALVDQLEYLSHYGDMNNICEIHPDFAPNSFAFAMLRPDRTFWFSGGLIYSGPGQALDGSPPALTVSLSPTGNEHNWSVHT